MRGAERLAVAGLVLAVGAWSREACSATPGDLACGLGGESGEDADVGLLQAKVSEHVGDRATADASAALDRCRPGQNVACPGSRARCSGRQCCPPGSFGGPTFPCPSAPAGWGYGHCGTTVKKVNCLAERPSPAPSPAPQPQPQPQPHPSSTYHPHFDTTPDYLHIAYRAAGLNGNPGQISDNYYLVISDQGGCAGGCAQCCSMQRQVAHKMREYVAKRKARSPHSRLLFVLAGGDNFYWNGASPGRFKSTWKDVYGEELTSVPWFAVFGNHDFGNSDPGIGCPNKRPRFRCDAHNAHTAACGGSRPYSTGAQGYNSNALNANKGGVDAWVRGNWHQPDYTYYYRIPELNFELVAMDWNGMQFNALGGNGVSGGAKAVLDACDGSTEQLRQSLKGIMDASTELLNGMASAARSKNVAILSHYPPGFLGGWNFRRMYLDGMPAAKKGETKIFHFYGHTHIQHCDDKSSTGECVDFLTGGAGGCCSKGDLPAGFVSIAFTDVGTQAVECFIGNDCTVWPYQNYPGDGDLHNQTNLEEVCAHTHDDGRCPATE